MLGNHDQTSGYYRQQEIKRESEMDEELPHEFTDNI
jgi:hypothetical protein